MTIEEKLANLITEEIALGQDERRKIVSEEASAGHISPETEAMLYRMMESDPTEVYAYRSPRGQARYQVYDMNLDAEGITRLHIVYDQFVAFTEATLRVQREGEASDGEHAFRA